MARPRRTDCPGEWHHVWGRGLGKKPIFENRAEIRRFQAALARAARRGDLEVHSFAFLTTHFHLLVRSPRGRLSEAMSRVLSDFTRFYNRTRDRDGTVWRGRFSSKPVRSLTYRRILVRYIDANPVQAGLAEIPWAYEHGSAQGFVYRTPKWLARAWIDEEIRARTGREPATGGGYEDAFPVATDRLMRFADARIESTRTGPDPLDRLVDSSPPRVRRWLEQRSRLADGTSPGHPVVDPTTLGEVLAAIDAERPGWRVRPRRKAFAASRVLAAALFRDLCGLTLTVIAKRVGVSITYVRTLCNDHRLLMSQDALYAEVAVAATLRALACVRSDS